MQRPTIDSSAIESSTVEPSTVEPSVVESSPVRASSAIAIIPGASVTKGVVPNGVEVDSSATDPYSISEQGDETVRAGTSSIKDITSAVDSDSALLWRACAARLEATTDPHVYSAYIKPLRLKSFTGDADEIVISAPNRFLRNYIESNFSAKLSRVLGELRGGTAKNLRFVVDADTGTGDQSVAAKVGGEVGGEGGGNRSAGDRSANRSGEVDSLRSDAARSREYVVVKTTGSAPAVSGSATSGLNSRYTFDNFVVGSGNQFCHAAAMRVAEQPGKSYNPLFIYGGVGLGKTHLLHAIGNAVLERNSSARVAYMSSEAFTNELIQSLRNAKMDEFKSRLRNIEVLLIDDIQFICGKERTQEEFFHTFNSLYGAKHQIVITSDKIPSKIPGIEERLQTRFSWGLTADIQAPDFETRVAIVRRKAALDGFALAENVAVVLAENISSNVRELEGALTHLQAKSAISGVSLTPDVARSLIRPFVQSTPVCISVDDIKRAVSNHFNIKVSDIISKRRTKNLSWPRHIAMYLCRKHTTASYPEIGNQFGGRDHSSVIHAANVVTTKVASDVAVQQLVREIEKKLLGD